MQDFSELANGDISVLSASLLNRGGHRLSHALTLVQLATRGYVYLAPNQIELTQKGRELIVDGDPNVDIAARQVLQNIVNLPRTRGTTLINFDDKGRPSSGFKLVQQSYVQETESFDWLVKHGYYRLARKFSTAQVFSAPIGMFALLFAFGAATTDGSGAGRGALWLAAFGCGVVAVKLYRMFSRKLDERGQRIFDLLNQLKNAKACQDWDGDLLPWIWLTHSNNIKEWTVAMRCPQWWNGSMITWEDDLARLLKNVARNYPSPTPNYGSSGASGAGGGC